MTNDELSEDLIALANSMFDLARNGAAEDLLPGIDRGAPLNIQNSNGDTMLMLAAYHGHTDLVRELIRRGADLDLLNDRGQSPIAGAVFKDDRPTVEALLEAGADLDAGTPSARETAEYFQRTHLIELFTQQ